MKLLYLYIEDYHQVHKKRGINFDSNYRFEFDGTRLTFNRRHVLPRDFFSIAGPKKHSGRVECVSAIIGENGTGKTSVMSFINEVFGGGRSDTSKRFLYVLRGKFGNDKHTTYRCYDNFDGDLKFNLPSGYRERWTRVSVGGDQMLPTPPVQVAYFSPYYTTQEVVVNQGDAFIDISTAGLMRRESDTGAPLMRFESEERDRILSLIKRIGSRPSAFGDETPLPCPDSIKVVPDTELIRSVSRNFAHRFNLAKSSDIREMDHRYEDALDIGGVQDLVLQLCAAYIASMTLRISVGEFVSGRHRGYCDFLVQESLRCRDGIIGLSSGIGGAPRTENPERHWCRLTSAQQKEIRRILIGRLAKYELPIEEDPYLPGSVEAHASFLRMLDAADRLLDSVEQKTPATGDVLQIGIRNYSQQRLLYQFLGAHDQVLNGGLVDGKRGFVSISYGKMSTGEMAYLSLFARLNSLLAPDPVDSRLRNARDLIVFLDEAETTLHPEWQRQLVANVIWFFENFTQNMRVHVIFASHSPMLLSDIPKDNVCFLEPKRSHEAGSGYQSDSRRLRNTFGANVYDLYRLSFGLDTGVYGYLAKQKIELLKTKIKRREPFSQEDILTVQLLGDDLIRAFLSRGVR